MAPVVVSIVSIEPAYEVDARVALRLTEVAAHDVLPTFFEEEAAKNVGKTKKIKGYDVKFSFQPINEYDKNKKRPGHYANRLGFVPFP